MGRLSFSGFRNLRDNSNPSIPILDLLSSSVTGVKLEKQCTYLYELDVRKLIAVSISERSEELRLCNLI
jgi:hypothetical protein